MDKKKVLFFDAGPVISLVMSRLHWLLPLLKKKFGGRFYITPGVKTELVDRPLSIHRFAFEALQVQKLISEGVLEVYPKVPWNKVHQLFLLANHSFFIHDKDIDVLQEGEMESIACARETKAAGMGMDERTLRFFIENPSSLGHLLAHRFQATVTTNTKNVQGFSQQLQGIPIIRSVELVSLAYQMGLLDDYIPPQKNGREILLDAVLWTVKTSGCAVTEEEVEDLKGLLLKKKTLKE